MSDVERFLMDCILKQLHRLENASDQSEEEFDAKFQLSMFERILGEIAEFRAMKKSNDCKEKIDA